MADFRSRALALAARIEAGGSEGAQKGTLTIMCGGSALDVERARPILAAMGQAITQMGPVGAGQTIKAVNQVILAGTYLGVAEGLVLAREAVSAEEYFELEAAYRLLSSSTRSSRSTPKKPAKRSSRAR